MTPLLEPAFRICDFVPKDTVVLPRFVPGTEVWFPASAYQLDSRSGNLRACLPGLAAIVHEACATPLNDGLLERSGMPGLCRSIQYKDGNDCLDIAERLSDGGATIMTQFSLHAADWGRAVWLSPPELQARLNNKADLGDWVPEGAQPRRRIIAAKELGSARRNVAAPVVLKAGTDLGSGGGMAVRICRTQSDVEAALPFFLEHRDSLTHLIIEDLETFEATWCANVGVFDSGCVFWGAARQICDAAGVYQGNHVGAGAAAPADAGAIALAVGEKARCAGYRGVAGMDMGLTADGRLVVFDLNFRFNACTLQLLYHDAVCERTGAKVTRVGRLVSERTLNEAIKEIGPLIDQGRLIAFSSFDGRLHADGESGSSITVLFLGQTVEEVDELAAQLQ